jgi:Lrp/AsnC family transcriptional regulator
MDNTDLKILALLQENATITVAEIAGHVHLSPTPCWRRIRRLEEAGVIQKRVTILDPVAIGFGLSVFVEVQADRHTEEWLSAFVTAIQEMPEVLEAHRMTGDIDYLLRVAVNSMDGYDTFYCKLIERVPLKNVTSRFSMERVKSTTAYPLALVAKAR